MLVQDVLNAVSNDMRQVLSPSSPDSAIMIPWVDRIHKDVLHTSLYSYLVKGLTTIEVAANTSSYILGGSVRRISAVYDRTFDRVILPFESLGLPSNKGDAEPGVPAQIPDAMLSAVTMAQWPLYYQRVGLTNSIDLFPAPQKSAFAGTYEIYYEQQVTSLTSASQTMLTPDDALDLVVAGVNSLAASYLKNSDDFQIWKSQYEAMKTGQFKG